MDKQFILTVLLGLAVFGYQAAIAKEESSLEYENARYLDSPEKIFEGSLSFKECQLNDPTGRIFRDMECSVLSVPENYSEPDGKTIEIFVSRIRSSAKRSKPDPVVLIAGGPGQAATESFLHPWMGFQKISRQRDLYLIDQRGTGKSNKLSCEMSQLEADATDDKKVDLIKECVAGLDADLKQYTTSVAVKDLEEVRKKLGVDKWNLFGVSYGTRVAQHYMRRYPGSVRTAILDGVLAPDHYLGTEIAYQSQRALDELLRRCQGEKECHSKYPDLKDSINKLLSTLKVSSKDIELENFSSGEVTSAKLNYLHLMAVIRLSLYTTESSGILPVVLHAAYAKNNYLPLARKILAGTFDLSESISTGMHNSVICSEDVSSLTEKDLENARQKASGSYMGKEILDDLKLGCDLWPKGLVDKDFKSLFSTDIPVLLLSGSADPITPPAYADHASVNYSRKLHIIAEGFGHGVSRIGCVPTLMAKFVDEASTALDISCIEKQKPWPFFVDFNGPTP